MLVFKIYEIQIQSIIKLVTAKLINMEFERDIKFYF